MTRLRWDTTAARVRQNKLGLMRKYQRISSSYKKGLHEPVGFPHQRLQRRYTYKISYFYNTSTLPRCSNHRSYQQHASPSSRSLMHSRQATMSLLNTLAHLHTLSAGCVIELYQQYTHNSVHYWLAHCNSVLSSNSVQHNQIKISAIALPYSMEMILLVCWKKARQHMLVESYKCVHGYRHTRCMIILYREAYSTLKKSRRLCHS